MTSLVAWLWMLLGVVGGEPRVVLSPAFTSAALQDPWLVAFSEDQKRIAVLGGDHVDIVHRISGRVVQTAHLEAGLAEAGLDDVDLRRMLLFRPNAAALGGSTLFVRSAASTVVAFDLDAGRVTALLQRGTSIETDEAFAAMLAPRRGLALVGDLLLSAERDGRIRAWSTVDYSVARASDPIADELTAIAADGEGARVAVGTADGRVLLVDPASWDFQVEVTHQGEAVRDLVWSDSILTVLFEDGHVEVTGGESWSTEVDLRFSARQSWISRNGPNVVVTSDDGAIVASRDGAGERDRTLQFVGPPNGTTGVTKEPDGLRVVDVFSGAVELNLPAVVPIARTAFGFGASASELIVVDEDRGAENVLEPMGIPAWASLMGVIDHPRDASEAYVALHRFRFDQGDVQSRALVPVSDFDRGKFSLYEAEYSREPERRSAISEDGRLRADVLYRRVTLRDLESGRSLGAIALADLVARDVAFSPDNAAIALATHRGLGVWDIATKARLGFRPGSTYAVRYDERGLLFIAQEGIGRWPKGDGDPVRITAAELGGGAFMGADSVLVALDGAWRACPLDLDPCVELMDTRAEIRGVAVAPGGTHVAFGKQDGSFEVVRARDGRSVELVLTNNGWAAHGDTGHFTGSKNAADLLTARLDGEARSIDPLGVYVNNPTPVLRSLGVRRDELLEFYDAKVALRRKSAGIPDHAPLPPPGRGPAASVELVAVDATEAEVRITCHAGDADLARMMLEVDGTPVMGEQGAGVHAEGQQTSHAVRVPLLAGSNHLAARCTDTSGRIGKSAQRVVLGAPATSQTLYFYALAVETFHDERVDNLEFVHEDAADLERVFKALDENRFDQVVHRVYKDHEVSTESLAEIAEAMREARPQDVFVMLISGHGLHTEGATPSYFYLLPGSDLDDLRHTALPFEALEQLLFEARPRNKLLLMDTCNSGVVDRQLGAPVESTPKHDLKAKGAFRAGDRTIVSDRPPDYLFARDRFVFNDLLRRAGAVVISSSRGTELSYESDRWRNGAFTEALLQSFTSSADDDNGDGLLSLDEVYRGTSRRVALLTGDRQHPTLDRGTQLRGFSLPINRRYRRSELQQRRRRNEAALDAKVGGCAHHRRAPAGLFVIPLLIPLARRRRSLGRVVRTSDRPRRR